MATKRLSVAGMMVGLLTVMFVAIGPNAPRADENSPVGTWFVYICPGSSDPCSTASPIINVASFTKEGTTINAAFGNPEPSPGLGIWVKTGHNQFALTFVELHSDVQGALSSQFKIRATLKYDPKPDTLAGPFRVDIIPAGRPWSIISKGRCS